MDVRDMKAMRESLDVFVAQFDDCVKMRPSRRHLRTYVAGQVGGLESKSVEPMALGAGVSPRALQKFLSEYRWDEDAMLQRLRELVMRDHASPDAEASGQTPAPVVASGQTPAPVVAVIDDTSFPKKGDKTAGVQRQYCGASGKIDNCVVAVHLGYVADGFRVLVDCDLFLPEASWSKDRKRCREAGIPDDMSHRPKWQIALSLLERSMAGGMRFAALTADEAYGQVSAFRKGVAALGLTSVVEVPCKTSGWTVCPPLEKADAEPGRGRPRTRDRLAVGANKARRVDRLWGCGGPSWQAYHVKDTEKGPVVWEARAVRFLPWEDGLPGEECWLVVARNVLEKETKYFLSNASKDTPVEKMLGIAFSRAHIERCFEDAKGEVGMDHFEVRTYLALKRHLILSMVSLLFLTQQSERLRGKKSVLEPVSGAADSRGAA